MDALKHPSVRTRSALQHRYSNKLILAAPKVSGSEIFSRSGLRQNACIVDE
jgi:hypothetical protein